MFYTTTTTTATTIPNNQGIISFRSENYVLIYRKL